MKKRNVFLLGLLVMLLAMGLVLAGCGDAGSGDDGSNNSGGNNNGETSVPNTPTGITASRNPAGSTTVTVSWNAASGATGYNVYYSSSGSGPGSLEGPPSATSFDSFYNSTSGTHYFSVSAVNSAGESSPSSWVSVGPVSSGGGTTIPSVPTGVTATAISSSSISVSWNSVSGATGYYIYRSSTSSGTYSQVGTSSSTLYTNSGLSASTTYYYKVAAYNSSGTSSQSSYDYATTQTVAARETRLDQPTFGTCSISGSNAIFNWTLKTTGTTPNGLYDYVAPASIKIEVYAEGTSWYTLTSTLSGTARTYTLSNWETWSYIVGSSQRVSLRVTCIRSGNSDTSAIMSYWKSTSGGTSTWVPTY